MLSYFPVMKNDKIQYNWDDLKYFLALARAGTLLETSKKLKCGVATISRKIDRLELAFNTSLFLRHQSGYTLTDEGEALIAKAELLENTALELSSQLTNNTNLTGTVRLATAENLANNLIIPNLPQFRKKYPGIKLEIATDITTVNIHKRDADLAIRMSRPNSGNLVIQKIATMVYGLFASTEYLNKRKESSNNDYFKNDKFIGWDQKYENLPAAKWILKNVKSSNISMTTTSLMGQIMAAKAGLGIVIIPRFLADKKLKLIKQEVKVSQDIWLVTHKDLQNSNKTKAVANFLKDLFKEKNPF